MKRQSSGLRHYLAGLANKLRSGGGVDADSAKAIALEIDGLLEEQEQAEENLKEDLLAVGWGDIAEEPPWDDL